MPAQVEAGAVRRRRRDRHAAVACAGRARLVHRRSRPMSPALRRGSPHAASRSLDAPVSGGPAKAAAGTMTMMVSGDDRRPRSRAPGAGADHRPAVRAGTARRRRVDVQDRQQPARRGESRGRRRGPRARRSRRHRPSSRVRGRRRELRRKLDLRRPRAARARRRLRAARRSEAAAKDVGIAATLADRLGVDAPFDATRRTRRSPPRSPPVAATRTTRSSCGARSKP